MTHWNEVYKAHGVIQKDPSAEVVSAIARFRDEGISRVLDLGCGTGRHTTLLVDAGFEVNGCDTSAEALRVISNLINGVDFEQCDMTQLPYENEFFDGILCNHVIQHGRIADAQKAAEEMWRILRPGGLLFLVVVSTEHPKASTGREIESNTRIDTDGVDGDVPHHFFTDAEMRELFKGFTIDELTHITGQSELDPDKGMAAWKMYATKKK